MNNRKITWAYVIGLFLMIVGFLDSTVLFIWRTLNHHDGPLLTLGGWVVVWEGSASTIMAMGGLIIILYNAILLSKKSKK